MNLPPFFLRGDSMKNIYIIGLGLMGASLAKALHGFENSRIIGLDQNQHVCEIALNESIVHNICKDTKEIADADMVIFCVYAKHIPGLLEDILPFIKTGCIISDICGVKSSLYEKIFPLIPEDIEYVGIHPMAGKERDGIENASPDIYKNSSMLICPTPHSSADAIQLMESMAAYIGCCRTEVVNYKLHDHIIAYTSNLMHAASAGLCIHFPQEMNMSFTAGAFRDCTRIADINAEAWTELLMDNRLHTINALETYINDLIEMKNALIDKDSTNLFKLFEKAGNNKRDMMRR